VADLGEGTGGPGLPLPSPPALFWIKKEEITEGGKAARVSKTNPAPHPLAQGLDPPLLCADLPP